MSAHQQSILTSWIVLMRGAACTRVGEPIPPPSDVAAPTHAAERWIAAIAPDPRDCAECYFFASRSPNGDRNVNYGGLRIRLGATSARWPRESPTGQFVAALQQSDGSVFAL